MLVFFYYVDQIADGMTLQVKVVNLLLETGGGSHREGGAAWYVPFTAHRVPSRGKFR